jgi:mRNA interferase RelE/StbE
MEIRVNKTFLKELAQILDSQRLKIEQFVFNDTAAFQRQQDIPNLRKLKGYKYFYRIRFGNYRAGVRIENDILIFERLLHRKDIYKFYP